MLNYWWVTRPKRKLNAIPEILACCANVSLNCEWQGNRYTHLAFEQELENCGLKRIGERRDQRGSGGRTYFALLFSLGLVFTHKATQQTKLTLAGEALINGESPVSIIKNQILKYQFPSPFSLSPRTSKSRVHERFHIRPFRFLLKLLRDENLGYYLTQDEIAKIIVTEAENETARCYKYVVNKIIQYRNSGESVLENNFFDKYVSSSKKVNPNHPYSHLEDLANTIINWLEYTQLIIRSKEAERNGVISILPEKITEVDAILNDNSSFIERPQEEEYFQRKYGLKPGQMRDNRNLLETRTITSHMIDVQKIRQAFLKQSLHKPIIKITVQLIDIISDCTGINRRIVDETLMRLYPHGAIGGFMTEYFEMAFKGRDEATDFEKATFELFQDAFNFNARHIGPIGRTPDVLIISDTDGYQAIIDNKAYSQYTISNDHHNRMVHNYIENIQSYSDSKNPLAFFSYIAGGFSKNIDTQLKKITLETKINGSAMCVTNIIKMIEKNQTHPYTHTKIKDIFSLNRQVYIEDL